MNRRITAAILAAIMLLALLPAGAGSEGASRGESMVCALEPRVSDGVTVSESAEGSMRALAHEEDGMLVFDENTELSVTVTYGAGWLICEKYSHFFDGDGRASHEETAPGVYVYSFAAHEGESVALSAWEGVVFNASCSELPKLYIEAEEDFADIGKEEWVPAEFTLTLGTKQFSGGDYEGAGFVKGRGNSSWTYPKKPYSIKLDSKASLLGIPKTKKYAIIPSYHDGSLMRNYITYKTYQGLVGIDYVPKCEFVDVYLNGEYNGIYILVERIDIEKSKIDIEEADASDLSGGYLIEKDIMSKVSADDILFDCPYWANASKDVFVLKTPEPEDEELESAMRAYLEEYMQRVNDGVMGVSGESWSELVDVSSWVDFIILQEIAKNIDGNLKTSCFMLKKRGDDRLYMTAPWDFDFAYGRVTWNNQAPGHNDVDDCPAANTADGFMIVNSSNPWMDTLYDSVPAFRRALFERYAEYRHTLIDGMFDMIDEQAAYLSVVQQANFSLWGFSFHSGVSNLRTWLSARLAWLDSQWLVSSAFEPGDVNMDGQISGIDALMVMRAALGLIQLTPEEEALADYDGNGLVNAQDALAIMRKTLGLIP